MISYDRCFNFVVTLIRTETCLAAICRESHIALQKLYFRDRMKRVHKGGEQQKWLGTV